MQIYLPYRNYIKCAQTLNSPDLVKQRENAHKLLTYLLHTMCFDKREIRVLDIKSYKNSINNPIFQWWWNNGNPFIPALDKYLDACNFELFNRHHKIMKLSWLKEFIKNKKFNIGYPQTPTRITTGYRIILICHNEEYYKHKFFNTYKKNVEIIKSLKTSKEKFKFSKFLGLKIS